MHIGIDAGLRHGAVIGFTTQVDILDPRILFTWKPKDSCSVGLKSTPREIMHLCNLIVDSIPEIPESLSIDWTPNSGLFQTSKKQTAITGFFMGMLFCELELMEYKPNFLSPHEIRQTLGLKPKTRKSAVHMSFRKDHLRQWQNGPHLWNSLLLPSYKKEGDILDALILAYVGSKS